MLQEDFFNQSTVKNIFYTLIVVVCILGCKPNKMYTKLSYDNIRQGYNYIAIENDFDIMVTDVTISDMMPNCFSTPFSLVIGTTNNTLLPKKIAVLINCTENITANVGDKLQIHPILTPNYEESKQYPAYYTKDTIINKQHQEFVVGAEYSATWGSIVTIKQP